MSIKITEKILSITPYISTSWSKIAALHAKENTLTVTLTNGSDVEIPNLDPATLEMIFQHHAQSLEKESSPHPQHLDPLQIKNLLETEEPGIRFAFGTSMEGMGSMMQHNPNQADAPDLPPEILQKIKTITKIITSFEENIVMPNAEQNCNCFYCQIARTIKPGKQI